MQPFLPRSAPASASNKNPDQHRIKIRILFKHFFKGLSLYLEARIWIRIRIKVTSRIRIRITGYTVQLSCRRTRSYVLHVLNRVVDPDSIGSVDPDSESGSGRAKMTHKSRQKFLKVHVLKCWMASFES